MTVNCLAPGFIKLFYTSNSHPHVQTIGINPQNTTGSILTTKGGTTNAFDAAIDDIVALFKAMIKTTGSYTGAELYTQADCSSAPVFRFAYDLGGAQAGTASGATQVYQQLDMTYRTQLGGRFKLMFMEGAIEVNDVKQPVGVYSGAIAAINAYLASDDNVIYARDNSYSGFALNVVTKVNDALRKKYLNP
jgi:hypothetical protein